jgi:hypothetical protein
MTRAGNPDRHARLISTLFEVLATFVGCSPQEELKTFTQ